MSEFTNKTIREIAVETPAATGVFEELKIDFCCGGNMPFDEACQTAGVSPDSVVEKISAVIIKNSVSDAEETNQQKSVSELIDLIVEKHHLFTRQEIGRLKNLMEKVAFKHGEKHTELFELRTIFNEFCNELTNHMQKEEFILFPHIKNLETAIKQKWSLCPPQFGTVQNPVRMMNLEHDTAGETLKRMRNLTNDYKVPENACPSFTALYFGLEELEKDLHQHIHLENNLLFPLSLKLEGKIHYQAA